jgi:hypothetical protein
MRANVSLLTETAQTAVDANVVDYQNAVAAHVSGDWSKHNQFQFYATVYSEPVSGHTVTDAFLLRVQLTGTDAGGAGDGVFTLPAIFGGTLVSSGSVPVILQHPSNLTVVASQAASFNVVAASATAMTYQWQFGVSTVAGAVSSTLVIPSAQSANQGNYRAIVSNSYGSMVSNYGTLTVTPAPTLSSVVSSGGGGGGNSGPRVSIL